MKKFFTMLGGLLLASGMTVNAEEVTVYISDENGDEIAYSFDADLTRDTDGVYTLANLFKTSDDHVGIPFSFKFAQPEVGGTSPIEVTSKLSAIEGEGYEDLFYIKNSNDKYPVFWLYDLNGNEDWVRLRYSYIYLGEDGSNVYRFDKSDTSNKYDYCATLMICGTYNGYNEETEAYDKELEESPWLYVEFWFNEPEDENPGDDTPSVVTQTINVTVDTDEATYYPDYDDEETYSEKSLKSFDAQLEITEDGVYTLKNIFGSDYSISYKIGSFNPKNQAAITYTGNIYAEEGYEKYPYFLTPDGDYMTVNVEEESGEKMTVEYLTGYQSSSYAYVYKCSDEELAAGYNQYYVYMYLYGYVGDSGELDMNISFGYDLPTSGVAGVQVNENAPVEYYNLQGVKVANPSKGIFVRRQGGDVKKVVIK